jgi:16S rRNA (uracil1498-N3)-methyltransferase
VVERDGRTAIATFFVEGPFETGITVKPSADVLNHLRARRLVDGDAAQLTDGAGHLAAATIRERGKRDVELLVSSVTNVARQPEIHLCAPIADRDRMLWLAEKATELEIATWQAARFRRSASVTPRGEGAGFESRAHLRMIAALEQSSGAWLPSILPDADVETVGTTATGVRVVMDPHGAPLLSILEGRALAGVTVLVGPEGGIEDDELASLERAGWRRARLGATTLRFETAAIAAIAAIRAAQCSPEV